MKTFTIAFLAVILSVYAANVRFISNSATKRQDSSLCVDCVDMVSQLLPQIEQIIAEGGVLEECAGICNFFQQSPENGICNLVCDIVGVRGFVDLLNVTDPNPIFICQTAFICPKVANGAVTINSVGSSPAAGPRGTIFDIYMNYTVTSPTGPGLFVLEVGQGDNNTQSAGYADFTVGEAVGAYSIQWEIQATPTEQESFDKGRYTAYLAACAGDCSTDHDYSGVYASADTSFVVTDDL